MQSTRCSNSRLFFGVAFVEWFALALFGGVSGGLTKAGELLNVR